MIGATGNGKSATANNLARKLNAFPENPDSVAVPISITVGAFDLPISETPGK